MSYVVEPGDTLSSIAEELGMTLEELLALNPGIENPNQIGIGQELNVDDDEAAADPDWGGPTGGPDYTSDDDTRFNGLGGEPEIWKDTTTGQSYVVYFPPGQDPPIPVLWEIPSQDDLESFFGDKPVSYDQQFSSEDLASFGSIKFGTTDNIPDKTSDPLAGFQDRMERAMEVQPWLADPEIFALTMAAYIEDRDLEEWELSTTDYWQGLNEAERNWIATVYGDPSEAERVRENAELAVYQDFRSYGIEPTDELVAWLANVTITGGWSAEKYTEQMLNLAAGKPGRGNLDDDLKRFLKKNEIDLEPTELKSNQIRAMWDKWLGPAYAPTDDQVGRWAAKLRAAPDATMDELENMLRDRRMAIYDMYSDPNATYQDFAQPWREFVGQQWGELPDETDNTFLDVVRLNNATEAGKLLRKVGLRRGNETVMKTAADDLFEITGGSVRKAI